MITRCPQCHAWFRVRAEHLSAAGGFVTCGDCDAVFNALLTLVDEREAHGAQARPVPRIDEPVPAFSTPPAAQSGGEAVDEAPPAAQEPASLADAGTAAEPESAPAPPREAARRPDPPPHDATDESARAAVSSEDPVGDLFDLETDTGPEPASETARPAGAAAPVAAPPEAEPVAAPRPASLPEEPRAETPPGPAEEADKALQSDDSPPQLPDAGPSPPGAAASSGDAEPTRSPDVEMPAVAALASGPAPAPGGHALSAEDHAILFTTPGGEDDDDDDVEDTVPEYDSRAAPPVLQADLERLSGRRAKPARAAWGVGLALLALAALAQLAWLERARIVVLWPASAPWVERICSALACRDGPIDAPTSIRLLARDVREHPQYRDALLVNATLVNTAALPRPYPVIELSLHDARGTVLGARRFAPQEYLDDSIALDAGMPPDRPVYVVMELGGDALEATSFEFTFL